MLEPRHPLGGEAQAAMLNGKGRAHCLHHRILCSLCETDTVTVL